MFRSPCMLPFPLISAFCWSCWTGNSMDRLPMMYNWYIYTDIDSSERATKKRITHVLLPSELMWHDMMLHAIVWTMWCYTVRYYTILFDMCWLYMTYSIHLSLLHVMCAVRTYFPQRTTPSESFSILMTVRFRNCNLLESLLVAIGLIENIKQSFVVLGAGLKTCKEVKDKINLKHGISG